MTLYEYPGRALVEWNAETNALVIHVYNYSGTVEVFREIVVERLFGLTKEKSPNAWIVDSSAATGAFQARSREILETEVFPAVASLGVGYLLVIPSAVSPLATMTVESYAAGAEDIGITTVEVGSVAEAIEWLRRNAGG
ncbi:MAG: hypothetical protein GF419_05525 [Ignavibacteriales bacterium]|nr:hypothetical protein [Ignavibacteriales bacterium]